MSGFISSLSRQEVPPVSSLSSDNHIQYIQNVRFYVQTVSNSWWCWWCRSNITKNCSFRAEQQGKIIISWYLQKQVLQIFSAFDWVQKWFWTKFSCCPGSSLSVSITWSCIARSKDPSTDTPSTSIDPLQNSSASAPADPITSVCTLSASFVLGMGVAQIKKKPKRCKTD